MAKSKASTSTPQKAPAPKVATPAPAAAPRRASSSVSSTPTPQSRPQATLSPHSSPQEIAVHVWNKYLSDTPPRTLLLDVFMAYLVLLGVIQFAYCVVAGNYPFNAFLSGFGAAVGQFVLTASLRMQTSERSSAGAKKSTGKTIDGITGEVLEEGGMGISSERAFADFLLGSLILHGFCVNFIN